MNTAPAIRPPAVAGSFYPQPPAELSQQLLSLLGEAPAPDLPGLKVVLVPHAGYVYSGSTAARLYASLISQRHRIRRVILLGAAHRMLRGYGGTASNALGVAIGHFKLKWMFQKRFYYKQWRACKSSTI